MKPHPRQPGVVLNVHVGQDVDNGFSCIALRIVHSKAVQYSGRDQGHPMANGCSPLLRGV